MPLAFISSFPMGMPLREGYEAVTGYPAGHRLAVFLPLVRDECGRGAGRLYGGGPKASVPGSSSLS